MAEQYYDVNIPKPVEVLTDGHNTDTIVWSTISAEPTSQYAHGEGYDLGGGTFIYDLPQTDRMSDARHLGGNDYHVWNVWWPYRLTGRRLVILHGELDVRIKEKVGAPVYRSCGTQGPGTVITLPKKGEFLLINYKPEVARILIQTGSSKISPSDRKAK